jgi:type II secretory pathway component PulF
MHYEYTAKSTAGETSTGLLTATSEAEAHHQLREKDLFVVSLKSVASNRPRSGQLTRLPWGRAVSRRDLVTLTSQLAIMCRAGVDLASALDNIAGQCPNPALKQTLKKIHEGVLSGKSVSQALTEYEHVFGQSYVAGVAAAEAAGRLPEVLDRLASLLRSQLRVRSAFRSLMAYPALLASISMLVIFALMFFVLPQFAGVFKQLDIALPTTTQLLIAVSVELRSRFWLWGGLLVAAILSLLAFAYSTAGRRFLDRLLLNLVFVRDVTRSLLIGRGFRLLGTMLQSGVPLLEGLQLTRSSIRNSLVRELFDTLEHEVINGRGLAGSFLASPFVPPAAAQMIATAEQTGTLATVAQLMGEFYEEEAETRLRELATILEPLIIILMGVVVAFVVMSVMLPVFDFATATK